MGIRPQYVRLLAQGLEGRLDRTKTSGPGRRIRWLPFFVSRDAWLATSRWLEVGYDLLCQTFSYDRDYLIPAVKDILDQDVTWVKRPPDYRDFSRATNATLLRLRAPAQVRLEDSTYRWESTYIPLFEPGESAFWTEHSPRSFVNGHAAVLGIEKAKRDFLGRWLPEQSDDYLRTARAVVLGLQRQVAVAIRSDPTKVVEDETMGDLQHHLEQRGVHTDRITLLKMRMEFQLAASVDTLAPHVVPEVPVDLPQMIDLENETKLPYIVHYTPKTRFSRLHRAGGCRRRPGRELREVTFHATISEAPFMDYCTDCWPSTAPVSEGTGPPVSDSDSSSSESDS